MGDNAAKTIANPSLCEAPWHPEFEVPSAVDHPVHKKQPTPDLGSDRIGHTEKYTSPEVLKLEQERLFSKVWVMAGHLNDIPTKNRYLRYDLGSESILVVRGEGEEVRAFYNVCQHRGSRLVLNDYGVAERFTCPFHRWEFNVDGSVAKIPYPETFRPEVLCKDNSLAPVKAAVWRGWVFINMDPDAAPLEEFLDPEFRAVMDNYDFRSMVRVNDIQQIWDVNWKAGMEAFIESYHVGGVHKGMQGYVNDYYSQFDVYAHGHSRAIFPTMDPAPEYIGKLQGKPCEEMKYSMREAEIPESEFPENWQEVRTKIIEAKRRNGERWGIDYSTFTDSQIVDTFNYFFFPMVTFNTTPESLLVQSWLPHETDPNKCYYRYQIFILPQARWIPSYMIQAPDADRSGKRVLGRQIMDHATFDGTLGIVEEDSSFLPRLQAGIHSRGFKGMLYSDHEIRNRQFIVTYDGYMAKTGD